MAADHQVFLDRQVLEHAAALEHLGDAAHDDVVRRQMVQPLAAELDRALGDLAAFRVQQPGDRLQRGGLARAVGAEQRGDLPLTGGERDALQHQDHAVVDDLDVVQRQHARSMHLPALPRWCGRGT